LTESKEGETPVGLKLLQLLMLDPQKLEPMAHALTRLLSELLLDASTPDVLPEEVRAELYATVGIALQAFELKETQCVLETLVPCAWAEFATPEVQSNNGAPHSTGPLKVAVGPAADTQANGTFPPIWRFISLSKYIWNFAPHITFCETPKAECVCCDRNSFHTRESSA
jgi:hypothetical protein